MEGSEILLVSLLTILEVGYVVLTIFISLQYLNIITDKYEDFKNKEDRPISNKEFIKLFFKVLNTSFTKSKGFMAKTFIIIFGYFNFMLILFLLLVLLVNSFSSNIKFE